MSKYVVLRLVTSTGLSIEIAHKDTYAGAERFIDGCPPGTYSIAKRWYL